jgi:uncharacterized membrane protein YbhN (UPF0104 family)
MREAASALSRRLSWRAIGFALSAAIIGISLFVLWRILRDISIDQVLVALRAIPVHNIVLAALFVAAGYLTYTFYDLFSLRTIGKHDVPYRIAALASTTSYAIGHNVGATVFTAGTVRYRIYSFWGLTLIDVAKMAFVTGLTFWLGNITALGLAVGYEPEAASAINLLPPWANQAIALAVLVVLVGYVAWVWHRPRVLGRDGWSVTLPNGPLTLVQIGIGILDLTCCAAAMYQLLPGEPSVAFVTLTVVFICATLLGFASHAPGSIGVFDAAMLVALAQLPKEGLVAGLLLFRLLYFVIPLILSLGVLGVRELLLAKSDD